MRSQLKDTTHRGTQELCLGLVVLPKPGQVEQTYQALDGYPGLELGEIDNHRIPAVGWVKKGEDENYLKELKEVSSALQVNVVFARLIEEEEL